MADALPLGGWNVVLTRPAHSAVESIEALRAAGARAVCLPVMDIVAIEATPAAGTARAHAAIFVSGNAVAQGLPRLRAQGFAKDTPCFAVGAATAAALKAGGQMLVEAPMQGFDSEHLLALGALQDVAGRIIVLVKGEGEGGSTGRTLIEDTLAGRGATVLPFICYRRRAVTLDAAALAPVLEWLASHQEVVMVVASGESLVALMDAFGQHRQALMRTILAVPHARVAALARVAGFSRVWTVALSADGLVETLSGHAAGRLTDE
jgi:uroporphyrinogen-III synthase